MAAGVAPARPALHTTAVMTRCEASIYSLPLPLVFRHQAHLMLTSCLSLPLLACLPAAWWASAPSPDAPQPLGRHGGQHRRPSSLLSRLLCRHAGRRPPPAALPFLGPSLRAAPVPVGHLPPASRPAPPRHGPAPPVARADAGRGLPLALPSALASQSPAGTTPAQVMDALPRASLTDPDA